VSVSVLGSARSAGTTPRAWREPPCRPLHAVDGRGSARTLHSLRLRAQSRHRRHPRNSVRTESTAPACLNAETVDTGDSYGIRRARSSPITRPMAPERTPTTKRKRFPKWGFEARRDSALAICGHPWLLVTSHGELDSRASVSVAPPPLRHRQESDSAVSLRAALRPTSNDGMDHSQAAGVTKPRPTAPLSLTTCPCRTEQALAGR
jgi:hypothetical protein